MAADVNGGSSAEPAATRAPVAWIPRRPQCQSFPPISPTTSTATAPASRGRLASPAPSAAPSSRGGGCSCGASLVCQCESLDNGGGSEFACFFTDRCMAADVNGGEFCGTSCNACPGGADPTSPTMSECPADLFDHINKDCTGLEGQTCESGTECCSFELGGDCSCSPSLVCQCESLGNGGGSEFACFYTDRCMAAYENGGEFCGTSCDVCPSGTDTASTTEAPVSEPPLDECPADSDVGGNCAGLDRRTCESGIECCSFEDGGECSCGPSMRCDCDAASSTFFCMATDRCMSAGMNGGKFCGDGCNKCPSAVMPDPAQPSQTTEVPVDQPLLNDCPADLNDHISGNCAGLEGRTCESGVECCTNEPNGECSCGPSLGCKCNAASSIFSCMSTDWCMGTEANGGEFCGESCEGCVPPVTSLTVPSTLPTTKPTAAPHEAATKSPTDEDDLSTLSRGTTSVLSAVSSGAIWALLLMLVLK